LPSKSWSTPLIYTRELEIDITQSIIIRISNKRKRNIKEAMAQHCTDASANRPDGHGDTTNGKDIGGLKDDASPLDPSLAPLLLFDGRRGQASGAGDDDDTMYLYSIPKRRLLTRSRRAAGFAGHRYWVTPQGWLLMLHLESHDTFLLNPLTLEKISLHTDQDDLLHGIGDSRCLLSHRPTDPDCVVLLLDLKNRVFYYCRPGGSPWLKHEHDSLMYWLTTVRGKFCSYNTPINKSQIITLEFSPNPTFTTRDLLRPHRLPTGYALCELLVIECRGELFSLQFCHPVQSDRKITQIVVCKLDSSSGAWLKVDTLDDAVFLVDNTRRYGASFDARQVGLGKGNCIYFITDQDKALYLYDLERGTIATHNPGLGLRDSDLPEFLMPLV
jgi:hypothetical protein